LTHLDDFDVTFSCTGNTALGFAGKIVLEVYERLVALDHTVIQGSLDAAEGKIHDTQHRNSTREVYWKEHGAFTGSRDHASPLVFRRQVQVEVENLLAVACFDETHFYSLGVRCCVNNVDIGIVTTFSGIERIDQSLTHTFVIDVHSRLGRACNHASQCCRNSQ